MKNNITFDQKKIEKLQSIESLYGIDIMKLLEAEVHGFYYVWNNHIYYSGNQVIRVGQYWVKTEPAQAVRPVTLQSCYYGDRAIEEIQLSDAHYWDWSTHPHCRIDRYGVEWALTREELVCSQAV